MKPFSRLGFGVTGPHTTPLVRPSETIGLVERALELGITLFDTGPFQGEGEGERRLGRALRGVSRETMFVCTKVSGRAAPSSWASSLASSLDRLGLEFVDAVFVHGVPAATADDIHAGLGAMVGRALTRHVGVCCRGTEVDTAMHYAGLGLLMCPVEGETLRVERAKAKGIGVLAIETKRGARVRTPRSPADLFYLARDLRDRRAGGERKGAGIAAALALPGVTGVLSTTTRRAHLEANAAEAGLTPPTGCTGR